MKTVLKKQSALSRATQFSKENNIILDFRTLFSLKHLSWHHSYESIILDLNVYK